MAKHAAETEEQYWSRLQQYVLDEGILEKCGCTAGVYEPLGYDNPWNYLMDNHGYAPMRHFLKALRAEFDDEDGGFIIDQLVRVTTPYNGWVDFCEHAGSYLNWKPSREGLNAFLERVGERAEDECHDGHQHEAQDRIQSTLLMVNELLRGHPGIEYTGAGAKIVRIVAELDEAYQLVGQLPNEF